MKIAFLIVFCLSFIACGSSNKNTLFGSYNPGEVLATVNGQDITEAQVVNEIKPNLKKIESELFKMKESALNAMISDKLIEQAAAKENKSTEAYLDDYFNKNVKAPTDEEIKRYYEFRKKQMGDKKFDDVKGQIADFLKANQERSLERRLLSKLRKDANIKIMMEPPRVDIKIGDSPTMGPKGAPITIIEFTDYQCPFCGRVRDTVAKILEEYPDEVIYSLKDFPLNFHKKAPKAHAAAHCAADQDKYWDMSKQLFNNQRALNESDLKKYAKKIGLNMKEFNKCLADEKYADKVSKGLKEGQRSGVTGTPAFFVNGILVSGARPFPYFEEIIEAELKRKN